MSQSKLGRAAELLFEAKCLLHGLPCFAPVSDEGKVDVIVGPERYRCQVKVLGPLSPSRPTRYLNLVKTQGRAGFRVRFRYTSREVDFMVGVNLDTTVVYVIPVGTTSAWSHHVSEQALERLGTKEAFHLLGAKASDETHPASAAATREGRRRSSRRGRAQSPVNLPPSLGLEFEEGPIV